MRRPSILSLFGRFASPFLVPVKIMSAAGRGRGQGRPAGRRVSRLALDADKPGCTLVVTETTGKTPRALRAFAALIAAFGILASGASASARQAAAPTGLQAEFGSPIAQAVSEAASRFGLPEAWIYAVMRQESGGRADAVSPKGAMGLLQLMPATWRELTLELGLGNDPYDVRANVLAGAAYLRRMYDRFGSPGFLAAYNAGPQRYADHLTGAQPLPLETRLYVQRVAPLLLGQSSTHRPASAMDPRGASLFVRSGHLDEGRQGQGGEQSPHMGLWP
ncbi:lytic transglycosylase domain-containing protein [Caulobacter vibrioides]|uniref:lytic transglycosylase domain-containing protein n=1 Tax=Caulobacter vibrioides TaxID=155892 RepID=UPI001E5FBC60|nr:lytic transglycosylase domain-containing protein [Caulobacter vibrioides]